MDFDPTEMLAKPLMAHLATNCTAGPRESPVWFLWEDGAIWLIGSSEDSFPDRLRVEPRCALGIVDFDVERGTLRHVGIRGEASIFAMDTALLHRLLQRYLGPDPRSWNIWFKANVVEPLDLMIKIAPVSIIARDMSYFKTGPEFAS